MSLFVRSNYSDLYTADALPVLEELFKTAYVQHPMKRERLCQVKQTERDIWQSSELHDMALFEVISEGEDYSYDRQKQGASKTLKPVKYGLGFSITEEAVEDGRFDMISDAMMRLGESARESQEIQGMNLINNGFSSETTADGLSLFNSAHTLPSGGTFRNVLSTAADLSVTSLEQMLIDFETQFVGDSGIIKYIIPRLLWCHPSNKRYARELVASSAKPDTADNNLNSFVEDNLEVLSSPHFTDTDAWGLSAEPSKNGLRIIRRKAVETKGAGPAEGFNNDSMYYKSRYREIVGAIHAYGIFGTAGAGS